MDELETRVWADLEFQLGREPMDSEFEKAFYTAEMDAFLRHEDNLEAQATGN